MKAKQACKSCTSAQLRIFTLGQGACAGSADRAHRSSVCRMGRDMLEMEKQGRGAHCHRSHFGSRYNMGCCGFAGLFVSPVQAAERAGSGKRHVRAANRALRGGSMSGRL